MHQRGALLSSLPAVGMKILIDNTILYRYINKTLHSFRLLEKSHLNIFFRGIFPQLHMRDLLIFPLKILNSFNAEYMALKLCSHKAWQYFRNSIFTNLVMMSISRNKDQHAGICKMKKKKSCLWWICWWKYHCIIILLKQANNSVNVKANIRLPERPSNPHTFIE